MDLTRELFCRPISRLLLCMDAEPNALYVGVTPDEDNPGSLRLSLITPCVGTEPVPYSAKCEGGKVRIEAGENWAELAIALPNKLLIHSHGLSLLFGRGKGAAVFMGGNSVVKDNFIPGGAMMAASGIKLRYVPRKGEVDVRAQWGLETLSDPDPRIYIHPAADGEMDFVVYESSFDEPYTEDGMTVEQTAAETVAEFDKFLGSIKLPGDDEAYIRAAYCIWTALQPDRDLNEKRITAPEYTAGRGGAAIAEFSDSVLLSLLFKDKAVALKQMASFLKYMQEDGLVPRYVSNKYFALEAQLPLFGLALKELLDEDTEVCPELYEALCKAFGWWRNERYCPERKIFYYLHRYEPGCGNKLPFADVPPEFAPDLNAMMLLWAEALAAMAKKLGKENEAAEYTTIADETRNGLLNRLWNGKEFFHMNIMDQPVCESHPRAHLPVLVDSLPADVAAATANAFPIVYSEDAIFFAYGLRSVDKAKCKTLAAKVYGELSTLPIMTVRQALTLLLVCGAAN